MPAAGYCGTNPNVGFGLLLWLPPGTTVGSVVTIYFKDNGGNLHTLFGGGSVTISRIPGPNGGIC